MELTHASFFSGAGGLDLGLERAGWRTVSHSEIEPYACAVLRHHWPEVPNLGDITEVQADDIPEATLWSGGFPCQDLSVAGRRAGLAGARSGLALTFLDLVRARRPEAVLLENVPGLLSSNAGRDLGALASRLAELGYGWAYRILDAQFFGVPQRRRRLFLLALHLDRHPRTQRAAEVLSVGTRCDGDHAPGETARFAAPGSTVGGAGGDGGQQVSAPLTRRGAKGVNSTLTEGILVGALTARGIERNANQNAQSGHFIPALRASGAGYPVSADDEGRLILAPTIDTSDGREGRDHPGRYVVGASPDPTGGGAADGLAGRLDDRSMACATALVLEPAGAAGEALLPAGLDAHRYEVCGNGVVAPVAEWLGLRIARAVQEGETEW